MLLSEEQIRKELDKVQKCIDFGKPTFDNGPIECLWRIKDTLLWVLGEKTTVIYDPLTSYCRKCKVSAVEKEGDLCIGCREE